jgi:hypothetical protein
MGAAARMPSTPATDHPAGATGVWPCKHLVLLLDRPNFDGATLSCCECNLFIHIHANHYQLLTHRWPWGEQCTIGHFPYTPARRHADDTR